MALDPEARQTSNTAMMISIGAIVLLALGALAYFATRNNDVPQTTVVTQPATTERVIEKTTEVPVAPPQPSTVVVTPPANNPAPVTRNEKTTVIVTPPANNPGSGARPAAPAGDGAKSNSTTNVTVNPPPAANSAGNSATPAATPQGY